MEYENLRFEKRNQIAWIILNRPDVGNAVSLGLAHELADVCHEVNQFIDGDQVRVVVIAGTRGFFSSGSDAGDPEGPVAADMATQAVAGIHAPVLAQIDGYALGAGLELALACDIRLAAEGAQFGASQVSYGTIPSGGGTQRLPRIVGRGKALEMILTSDIVDAQEAHRIGLVNTVFSPDDLAAATENLAIKIAAKGPIAERYSKEAIGKGLDMTLGQGLRLEADLSFLLQSTSDRDEGIRAFLEKRTPEFKGE